MKYILLYTNLLFAFLLVAGPVHSTEITTYKLDDLNQTFRVKFNGPFEVGNHTDLVSKIRELNNSGQVVSSIQFNSPGGLVEEAISVGKFIRQKRIATIAPIESSEIESCASACALAWLGGVYRIGEVLVHRSYLDGPSSPKNFKDWDMVLSKSQNQIRDYLKEIRVPDSVFVSADVKMTQVAG